MPSDRLMYSHEVEEAVLGAALLDPVSADRLVHDLTEADFELPRNQAIYRAICTLAADSSHLSVMSLREKLTETDEIEAVGGTAYLAGLDASLPNLSAVPDMIRTLHDRALRRQGVDSAREFARALREDEGPADSLLQRHRKALDDAEQRLGRTGESVEACEVASDVLHHLRHGASSGGGIKSGISKIDMITGGLQPKRLYVLAGRPGTGKSAMAQKFFQRSGADGKSAVFVTLEMGNDELLRRMLSTISGVDHSHIQPGSLQAGEWDRLVEAQAEMEGWKAWMRDDAIESPHRVLAMARRHKREHGLDLLVVDYLQLMASDRRYENRNLEITAATRALKLGAKELDCPILLLSQLNREAQGKRPTLANLRDSGAIEQDADVVMFLWCPNEGSDEGARESWQQMKGKDVEIDVAKNRHGPLGSAMVSFHGWTLRFYEVGS